jgi:hypothetical protein
MIRLPFFLFGLFTASFFGRHKVRSQMRDGQKNKNEILLKDTVRDVKKKNSVKTEEVTIESCFKYIVREIKQEINMKTRKTKNEVKCLHPKMVDVRSQVLLLREEVSKMNSDIIMLRGDLSMIKVQISYMDSLVNEMISLTRQFVT